MRTWKKGLFERFEFFECGKTATGLFDYVNQMWESHWMRREAMGGWNRLVLGNRPPSKPLNDSH